MEMFPVVVSAVVAFILNSFVSKFKTANSEIFVFKVSLSRNLSFPESSFTSWYFHNCLSKILSRTGLLCFDPLAVSSKN